MKPTLKSTIIRILITALVVVVAFSIAFILLVNWVNANVVTLKFPIEVRTNRVITVSKRTTKLITPFIAEVKAEEVVTPQEPYDLDKWIGDYADKFANKTKSASYLRYQLHCLANKESTHHANTSCGDSGKACGIYQFHQPTWEGFRKEMMKLGLITEIGSRLNDKQAVETTAWALANGRQNNWGPIVNKNQCL